MANSKPSMALFNCSIILLLSGYLFLGISHIAFLPPWEGFDETAHFSYIQQIADTGSLLKPNRAKLSKDVEEYKNYAPMPYSSIPPFEDNGGLTYRAFFESLPQTIQKGNSYVHLPPDKPRRYKPGTFYNWQAQHPPLYYALLSPIYMATRSFALTNQIFLLRVISYIFAWSALLITAYGGFFLYRPQLNSENLSLKHWLPIGTLSIPIFFPAWFPEMARIGNDSLCALLLSVLWLLVIRVYFRGISVKISVLLGLFMGLGCLTKAFFVPLSAGIIFCLILQQYTKGGVFNKSAFSQIVLNVMIIFIISGWWYLGNWLEGGALLGSHEMTILKNSGGIIEGLSQHFSLKAWLRGHAAIVTTLGWSGTWSLARPPYFYLAPLAVTIIFITISYLFSLPRCKINTFAWLPFWFALPVIMGFSYHVLVRIALTGEGRGTSGYYLLFMVPVIGSAISLGLGSFWEKKRFRFAVALSGLYAIGFSMFITWAQVLMFAGIIYKSGNNKFYQLPDQLPAYFGLPDALTNLTALVYPKFGVFCWFAGGILLTSGLILGWRLIGKSVKIRANQNL
jgi:hypothetical protein